MAYNKSYHRFFEGYTEKNKYDYESGKYRIERKYTGDLYVREVASSAFCRCRLLYIASFLIGVLALLLAGISEAATKPYTVIPILVGIILACWYGFYLTGYLVRGDKKLLIRQFRDRKNMMYSARALSAVFIILCAGLLLFTIINRIITYKIILGILLGGVAFILLLWSYKTENEMVYRKCKSNEQLNEEENDDESFEIRYNDEDSL